MDVPSSETTKPSEVKDTSINKNNIKTAILKAVDFGLNGQTFGYIFLKTFGFLLATAAGFVVAISLSDAVRSTFFLRINYSHPEKMMKMNWLFFGIVLIIFVIICVGVAIGIFYLSNGSDSSLAS